MAGPAPWGEQKAKKDSSGIFPSLISPAISLVFLTLSLPVISSWISFSLSFFHWV